MFFCDKSNPEERIKKIVTTCILSLLVAGCGGGSGDGAVADESATPESGLFPSDDMTGSQVTTDATGITQPAEVVDAEPPVVTQPPEVEAPPVVTQPPQVVEPPVVVQPPGVNDTPDDLLPVLIDGVEAFSDVIAGGDQLVFRATGITGILLNSTAGDVDLEVRDSAGNMLCFSNSGNPLDVCPNRDSATGFPDGFDRSETFEVTLTGFVDSTYTVGGIVTPQLVGSDSDSGAVSEGEFVTYVMSGAAAVRLENFSSADADLVLINENGQIICTSINSGSFDACNNVNGLAIDQISPNETYIVEVFGFQESAYQINSIESAGTLLSGDFVESVFIDNGEQITYFVQGVREVSLLPLAGDSDLIVLEADTGETVCFSNFSGVSIDQCEVGFGNYQVIVEGFSEESAFNLFVN